MNGALLSLVNRSEPANGIRSVDRPGWWVVPPWPDNVGVHDVVRHFLRFDPLVFPLSRSEADVKAYYVGYLWALDTASTDDLTCGPAWRWYHELRDCVAEAITERECDSPLASQPNSWVKADGESRR